MSFASCAMFDTLFFKYVYTYLANGVNLQLFGSTCLVGKMKFKPFFSGSIGYVFYISNGYLRISTVHPSHPIFHKICFLVAGLQAGLHLARCSVRCQGLLGAYARLGPLRL